MSKRSAKRPKNNMGKNIKLNTGKRRLTDEQGLAAKVVQLHGIIAQCKRALGEMTLEHSKREAELVGEIAQLKAQLFNAQITSEIREGEIVCQKHGLPVGKVFTFDQDESGNYWLEIPESPNAASGEAPEKGAAEDTEDSETPGDESEDKVPVQEPKEEACEA